MTEKTKGANNMPVSDAQRRATNKWRSTNMKNLAITVRADYAEEFKAACADLGIPYGQVLRQAVDNFMEEYRKKQG